MRVDEFAAPLSTLVPDERVLAKCEHCGAAEGVRCPFSCPRIAVSLYLGGESPESIVAMAAAVGETLTVQQVVGIWRSDHQWLYEIANIGSRGPGNLSTDIRRQCNDHCSVIDADPWARGYRAGYATAKFEDSDAVDHLGCVILARVHGVTREPTVKPKPQTTYEKAGRKSLGWSCMECGGHLDLVCPFGERCFHAGDRGVTREGNT